jgi:hypothetical protein
VLKRLMLVGATIVVGIFVQAASAAPWGSDHVRGHGSTIWGVWGEGSESFSLNVFTTHRGVHGRISWRGAKADDSPDGPLVHYRYAGHPSCLAVSGDLAVAEVVHYYRHQVFPYQGVLVIVRADGSEDQAWAELLEAGNLADAQSECSGVLAAELASPSLQPLDGRVTIG